MGRIVISCYQPKPGKAEELAALMKTHLSTLRAEGLVTDRESILMQAENGTIVEVFEWKSPEAIQDAHSNRVVAQMWKRYADVCDYLPIGQVEEASKLFSQFTPLER